MPHPLNFRRPVANSNIRNRADSDADKRRIADLESEVARMKKKLSDSGSDDAMAGARRNLSRAEGLRASGDLNASELSEIDAVIRDCNKILEGSLDSGRSPGKHARSNLGTLASLPPAFRNLIQRPTNSGQAHIDHSGIALDVDTPLEDAQALLRQMEGDPR